MSYGVWRKRGKGWSSFEIDGNDDWRWSRMPEARRKSLLRRASEYGLHNADWDDPSYIVWRIGQLDKGRTVVEVRTGGDHALFVAYTDDASKAAALAAHGYVNAEGERTNHVAPAYN